MRNTIKLLLREELLKIISEREIVERKTINEQVLLNETWKDIVAGALTFLSVMGGDFGEHKPKSEYLNLNNQEKNSVAHEFADEYQNLAASYAKYQTPQFKNAVNVVIDTISMVMEKQNIQGRDEIIKKIRNTKFVEVDRSVLDTIVPNANGIFIRFKNNNYILIAKDLSTDTYKFMRTIKHEVLHDVDISIDDMYDTYKKEFVNKIEYNPDLASNQNIGDDENELLDYLNKVETNERLNNKINNISGLDFGVTKQFVEWLNKPEEQYVELHRMMSDLQEIGIVSSSGDKITKKIVIDLLKGKYRQKIHDFIIKQKTPVPNWIFMLASVDVSNHKKLNGLIEYINNLDYGQKR